MKRMVLVGALVGAFAASTAFAQTTEAKKPAHKMAGGQEGHGEPKMQPPTTSATAPDGTLALGSVHIPKNVKADGKALAAGTYQVRLTPQTATPDAKGQAGSLERWVEFVKGGKVAGREVVSIVPANEANLVQKDTPPPSGGSKVETLKGGDYTRVWINKAGTYYLVHLAKG